MGSCLQLSSFHHNGSRPISQFHYCPKEGSEPYTGNGASLENSAGDGQSLKLIGAYYIDIHWESYWSY